MTSTGYFLPFEKARRQRAGEGGAKEHRGAGRRQVAGGALWGGLRGKMGGKGALTKIFSEINHRCG